MFTIKTLIELFDEHQIENIIAGLNFTPEKIVFIGFKEIMSKDKVDSLEKFFKNRGLSTCLEFEIVPRYDFASITDKLNRILDSNEDCFFDLTGGKGLALAAMGAVSTAQDVPMLQFNIRTGDLIKVKNCDDIMTPIKPHMTLDESVELNGCKILREEEDDFTWSLTEDFKSDLESIWSICKKNCGLWNRQSTAFGCFERFGKTDGLTVKADFWHVRQARQDVFVDKAVLEELSDKHLISDCNLTEESITFRYKNEQVRRCITKAGNILELYAYMLMREIEGEDAGYYDDIDVGVYIDWDGVIHDGTTLERDTKNEIDIMLMRDLVPVFISCKNGEVHKDALYELATVAEKFGGKYSKKYLLASYISSDPERIKYIKQRAFDMGITVIDGVHKMTRAEFKAVLKRTVR